MNEKDFLLAPEWIGVVKMLNSLTLYISGLSGGFVLADTANTHKFDWQAAWPFYVAGGLYAMGKTFVEISQAKTRPNP